MRSSRPPWSVVLGICAVVVLALAHRDEIRGRAEAALGSGMPRREAALARGFVLGEDDRIDSATVEDFRRAGLSHLLAASGQNVALLALLAMPLLAALGMPLRTRSIWILAAIVVYVPLAGAGPSILRAGAMGVLGVLATLAGRRASRLYALAIAAIVTLALDPRIGGDVGWQLSFAAVLGILILAQPLRGAIVARTGSRGWRGALAEGAAVTVAATLSTAPLIAFHFEALSTTTLIANLLALPAIAPAMWLGMLAAAGGQLPGFPVALLNTVNAPLLAYVAQVAAWCGRPGWAYLPVHLGWTGLIGSYAALCVAVLGIPVLLRRRRIASLRQGLRGSLRDGVRSRSGAAGARSPRARRFALAIPLGLTALGLLALPGARGVEDSSPPGLRVTVLDVGQGDSILLQPAQAPPLLVDGGPPGDGLAAKLRRAGVGSLGAAVITHEQSDHAGGIGEILGGFPVSRLLYARLGRRLRAEAEAAGADPTRIAEGNEVRSGALHLEVLWPPRQLLDEPLGGEDPNAQAIVLLARWGKFTMLLSADAEAGEVPLDPGPVDVLKVAHHGSEDPGLDRLLDQVSPRLAVISVGADNPYGHPTASALAALAAHGVPVLRTDRDGSVVIDVEGGSFVVEGGD